MKKRMFIMVTAVALFLAVIGFVKFQQIQAAIAQAKAYQPPPEAVTTIVAEETLWDPELRAIPVVMLTSSREETDLVESYRLGVNAYVVKPVDFSQFVEAIRRTGIFWAVVNQTPRRAPKPPA